MKSDFLKREEKPAPPRLALNQKETAAALGVSVPTIISLTRSGQLPVVTVGARRLYPIDGLRRWLEGATIQHVSAVNDAEGVQP